MGKRGLGVLISTPSRNSNFMYALNVSFAATRFLRRMPSKHSRSAPKPTPIIAPTTVNIGNDFVAITSVKLTAHQPIATPGMIE